MNRQIYSTYKDGTDSHTGKSVPRYKRREIRKSGSISIVTDSKNLILQK